MPAYYTKEKARYGGITGTIIPYPIKMPAVNVPDTGDWVKYLPAGFVRCDGSILSSLEYPNLAAVIGVGEQCKFKKANITLTDTQMQLPDLGSKYILGGNASGAYLNDTVIGENNNGQLRVGAEIAVTSLVGDTAKLSYEGYFEVIGGTNYEFLGNPQYSTLTSDTSTSAAFLTNQAFQGHGHLSDVGVFTYLARFTDNIFIGGGAASQGDNDAQTEGSNNLVISNAPTNGEAVVQHKHLVDLPSTAEVKAGNSLRYNFENTEIDSFGLETEVTLTTSNISKLDEATPPFILVEYLIKL